MKMRALHVVTVVGLLLAGPVRGEGKKDKFTVETIELRLFGQEDGKVHPFNNPPNAYGMHMNILVVVKLKGPPLQIDKKPTHVVLKIEAKGWSDEATGDHGGWRLERREALNPLPEAGVRYVLFVVPYVACYPEANFTVSVVGRGGGSTKTRKVNLGCAE
jgi:hypothetical protein